MHNFITKIYYWIKPIINFVKYYLQILLSNIKKQFYLNNYDFGSDSNSNSDSDSDSDSNFECSKLVNKLDQMGLVVLKKNYDSAQFADSVSGTKFQLVQDFLLNQIIPNSSCYLIDNSSPFDSFTFNRFKNSNLITLESVEYNFVFAFGFTLVQLLNKDVKNSIVLMQDIIEYYYNINLTSQTVSLNSLLDNYCLIPNLKNNKNLCKYLKEYILTIQSILNQVNDLYLVTTFDNLLTQEVIYFEPNTKGQQIKKSGIVKFFTYNVQNESGIETYVILYGYGFPIC